MPASPIRVLKHDLPHEPSRQFPIAAGTAVVIGAPVVLTSGLIVEASANPRDIVGFARGVHPFVPAGYTSQTKIVVTPAIAGPTCSFVGTLSDTALTRALAAADVGTVVGITKTGSVWHLDTAKVTAGTNTVALVLALIDPVGATAADTPSSTNSGASLVEFCLLIEATAYGTAAS